MISGEHMLQDLDLGLGPTFVKRVGPLLCQGIHTSRVSTYTKNL